MNSNHVFVWAGRVDERWTNEANWQAIGIQMAGVPARYPEQEPQETDAAKFDPEFVKKTRTG